MKRSFLISLFCAIGALVFCVQGAFASSEKINNFSVDIAVNTDSTFLVKESIQYDFGTNEKHGITRDIPLEDKMSISIQKVEDEYGSKYRVQTSKDRGQIHLRIGDPNKTITGVHTYNIFYTVKNGLGFFEDHDELYWNVTGTEWKVPIEKSDIAIYLPEAVSFSSSQFDCFAGAYKSTEKSCSWAVREGGEVYFEASRVLQPNEGLTIVFGWPKGIIVAPKPLPPWLVFLITWWPVIIPTLTFTFLFKKWWKDGKDPNLHKTIIAQYEPPDNLLPAELMGVINQKIAPIDFSATIVDLAVRGYIKIKEIKAANIFQKTDYELIKLKGPEGLADYEKEILSQIFESGDSVLISTLAGDFLSNFGIFKKSVLDKLTGSNYFVSNPQKVGAKYLIIGIAILVIFPMAVIFLANIIGLFGSIIAIVSIVVSGILFIIFSAIMPKRTLKGAEACWQGLGFKEYINTAEKYRLEFQEKENTFEKYLPYAISFGLVKKWAKAFEGIYNHPPTWYEGNFGSGFSAVIFVDSLNHSISNMNTMVSPQGGGGSGLGGGGFSGGGGGGGGGGSW